MILGMLTRPPRLRNIRTHPSLLTTGSSTSCILECRGPSWVHNEGEQKKENEEDEDEEEDEQEE